jgi:hypothetical protein
MEESRNCRHCGAAFVAKRKNGYYCSRTCKDRGTSAAYRARHVNRPCSVEGCDKPALDKSHCSMHYRRLRVTGDVGPAGKVRGDRFGVTPCSIEGCARKYYAKGMCSLHYNRTRIKGVPGGADLLKAPDGAGTVAIVGGYRRLQWYKNGKRIAIAEHRQVMEEVLGRSLEPFENNVHHRNGRRADNRPENLEVWIVPQPCGQRPEDLVDWVLDHYLDIVREKLRERNP